MLIQGEATRAAPMVYRPENGLSDSDSLKIACRQNSAHEMYWQGKGSAGKLAFAHINLRDGLDVWDFDYFLRQTIEISTREYPPTFAFSYCLQGNTANYYENRSRRFDFSAGRQHILYSHNTDNTSSLPANIQSRQISIFISPACLSSWLRNDPALLPDRLLRILEKQTDDLYCHIRPITPATHQILAQMANCPYTGITRKLFLESRVLDLICRQLELFNAEKQMASRASEIFRPVHPDERKQVRRVQERIDDSPETIRSLAALAREAGMSESKLNRTFKRVYGMTVFAYLKNTRLDRAVSLLSQGMTVTEAALGVGYENLSHFSKVFKNRFGHLPSRFACRKQR